MVTTSSGGMSVPHHVCKDRGEFLPHACAPVITILREK
jgi:ribosomal protein L32